ncbi:hypothetical protein [Oribacterium sp. FC2011]|uniref:hypothetical protein n=1 Tax=Oribacterium sp. FC2011 TaxID=1408311 RepID=UPI000ABE95C0|nr:hypothetical protein [Oribacterium sp. FC2011]
MFKYREMNEADNEVVAALVRDNLKQFGLDDLGESASNWGGKKWHEMEIRLNF